MKVAEWIEALRGLPQDRELSQLAQVTCAHCRVVSVATGWDETGDALAPGWRQQMGASDVLACSEECADAASRAAVLRGQKRPRWRMQFE